MWYPILHRYIFHYQGNLILAQSFPLAVSTVTYCRQHGGRDHDHLFKIESFPVSAAPGPIRIQQNSAGASLGILALNIAQIASLGTVGSVHVDSVPTDPVPIGSTHAGPTRANRAKIPQNPSEPIA